MDLTLLWVFGAIIIAQLATILVIVKQFSEEKKELLRAVVAKNLGELDQKDVSLDYYKTIRKTTGKQSFWDKKLEEQQEQEEGWVDADDIGGNEAAISRVQKKIHETNLT